MRLQFDNLVGSYSGQPWRCRSDLFQWDKFPHALVYSAVELELSLDDKANFDLMRNDFAKW